MTLTYNMLMEVNRSLRKTNIHGLFDALLHTTPCDKNFKIILKGFFVCKEDWKILMDEEFLLATLFSSTINFHTHTLPSLVSPPVHLCLIYIKDVSLLLILLHPTNSLPSTSFNIIFITNVYVKLN